MADLIKMPIKGKLITSVSVLLITYIMLFVMLHHDRFMTGN